MKTNVFISWSGKRSRDLASALKDLLEILIQDLDPWMSDRDLPIGERWDIMLGDQLEKSRFGVLCLTRENLDNSWLLFEAGALGKALKESSVVPYMLDISVADLSPPLSMFNGVEATKDGTFKLLEALNEEIERPLKIETLQKGFEKFWPELQDKITTIINTPISEATSEKSEQQYLREILELLHESHIDRAESGWERVRRFWERDERLVIQAFEILRFIENMNDDELSHYMDFAEEAWVDHHDYGFRFRWEVAKRWKKMSSRRRES